ncbi:hypothetical protein PMAYCL1PPCAC_21677, partial [Pristionchus mayeri]
FNISGVYSMVTVITYQIAAQFPFSENFWTVYIFKVTYGVNTIAGRAATIGKIYIAIHRYLVIRSREFSEMNWTPAVISRMLLAQFVISLASSAPIWPASYVHKNGVIISLDPLSALMSKVLSQFTYAIYIVINGLLTFLTSRELLQMKRILKANQNSVKSVVTQQRNMFIIVSVCTISHLVKIFQQVNV